MATKAQQQRFLNTAQEHQRVVVKHIQSVSRRHGIERVFSDFVEISAITLARLDQTQFDLLMAKIMMTDAKPLIEKRGFVRLLEPTSGAGGMVIAVAQILAEEGVNYQQCMHVTAIDIDQRCVHMTYIQCALLHIPAAVIHGNSLADEVRSIWYTPAHMLGGWGAKLRADHAQSPARVLTQPSDSKAVSASDEVAAALTQQGGSQMTLF